jgi:uncharacterized membrane protein SpoIIM required for sporulation
MPRGTLPIMLTLENCNNNCTQSNLFRKQSFRSRLLLEIVSALLIFTPLLVGGFFGSSSQTKELSTSLTVRAVFLQNLRFSLLIAIGGLLTFGLVPLVLFFVGFFPNGFAIGAAIEKFGIVAVINKQLHAPFELAGFILCGAAGFQIIGQVIFPNSCGAVPWQREIKRFFLRVGTAQCLLLVAAIIEVHLV